MHRNRHAARLYAVLAGAVVALAGCGGSSSGGTPAAPAPAVTATTPAPAASSPAAGSGTKVKVTESEFAIKLSQATITPGTYTFEVSNQGSFPHNLTIEGPGVDKVASATLQSGETGSLTVTLKAGLYEFWCSVDGHKDKGMDLTVKVY